jgi:hypothetical protein
MIKMRMSDPLISSGIAKKHGEIRNGEMLNAEFRISNFECGGGVNAKSAQKTF